ncbi:hypothetical protein [Portibacter lacus]|uniref:Outer membrane protein beta-barrel domain-containing protein n=1 Tax=Portibacter lacus TaxID=1099794 RepID=A0AA37SMB0_9BACT|nr:hypothetical protein [Portibacter lacus]GLR16555.1 hypothetical protein GCM10007940_11700 [Portibacter lacus]
MRLFVIIIILLSPAILFSQLIRPGISFTYIPFFGTDNPSERYDELTLNVNSLYAINKRHNIGIQYLNIWTRGSSYSISDEKHTYYLAGLFYQFDILKESSNEWFPEVSINYGNYCPCGNFDPFERPSLIYIGYGMGFDYKIYKNLYLDLGFHWYQPIAGVQKEDSAYSYTQYVLGVSYLLK